MTKHHIEGISDNPKYWTTKAERERTEAINARYIEIITNFVQPYHEYGDDSSYRENAAIDLDMLSDEMIAAIADALKAR